ncbi:MAG: putative C-S lyase [Anaerolineae bacterium]|nr:MAG: putative C-S lyase [Anaerolineae bacterium]
MPYDFDHLIERRHTNSIKWTAYPPDVLPLWVADMDFAAPEPILRALRQTIQHGILGYDVPGKVLRETVAARMKSLYEWEVAPQSVVPITGLVSGFYAAAQTLCRPGDGYLIQPPVYMPFNDIQKHQGVIRQEARLEFTTHNGLLEYHIDWAAFENAFHRGGSRTKMFLLCNPHNPTGQMYSAEELQRMAQTCLKQEAIIVSDEIHSELILEDKKHIPIASLSAEIAQNTITLVAPSKTFNIAGLFCGFAIIPNRHLRERYKEQVERMTLHVNSLGYVAAQAAFSGECDDWLAELRAYLKTNRDFLVNFIRSELPAIRLTCPEATYLAWLDCSELVHSGKIGTSPYEFFLKKARVALNDGATFGTGGEYFVRLNFACPRSTLEQALERMKNALA